MYKIYIVFYVCIGDGEVLYYSVQKIIEINVSEALYPHDGIALLYTFCLRYVFIIEDWRYFLI